MGIEIKPAEVTYQDKPQQTQGANQGTGTATVEKPKEQQPQAAQTIAPTDTVQLQGNNNGQNDKETLAIAQILAENNRADMPIDELARKLQEKGFNVKVVHAEGENGNKHATLQFLDKDGNVVKGFKDTSGDGQIGMQDTDFRKAVEELEKDPRYASLAKFLEVKEAESQAKRKLEEQYKNLGVFGMLGALGNNIGGENGIFQQIDSDLKAAGYNGHPCAAELWQNGQLEKVAKTYGVSLPAELYQNRFKNPYETFMQIAAMALLHKQYASG